MIAECDIVLWYPTGRTSGKPCPAFVTAVGEARNGCEPVLSLAAMRDGYSNLYPADGTPHILDPRAQSEHNDAGAWAYTRQHLENEALQNTVAVLKRKMEQMLGVSEKPVRKGWPKGQPRKKKEEATPEPELASV